MTERTTLRRIPENIERGALAQPFRAADVNRALNKIVIQVLYRYDGVESTDEPEVDFDCEIPVARTGGIYYRLGESVEGRSRHNPSVVRRFDPCGPGIPDRSVPRFSIARGHRR
jgi:hypothetical protein